MKKLVFYLILIYSYQGFGQFFIYDYSCPFAVEAAPTCDVRYNCITPMGEKFLIAGTISFSNSVRNLQLVILDATGHVDATYDLPYFAENMAGQTLNIEPTGVLYENTPSGDIAVVCGNLGNNVNSSKGFVLRYNLTTETIYWAKIFQAPTATLPATGQRFSLLTDIKFGPSNNYIVCGEEFTGSDLLEDGVIYSVGKSFGLFNKIINFHTLNTITNDATNDPSSDTFYALNTDANGDIIACGRSEMNDLGLSGMRPTLVKTTGSTFVFTRYFIKNLLSNGRLYALDFALAGNNIVTIVTGDVNGISTNLDLYAVKSNSTGNLIWRKKIDFPGAIDGSLNCINTYQSGSAYKSIIYGNKASNGNNVFLIGLEDNGSLTFSKEYPNIFPSGTFNSNSMIVQGGKIYAVGYTIEDGQVEKGIFLAADLNTGEIDPSCAIDYTPTIINQNIGNLTRTPIDPATTLPIETFHTIRSEQGLLEDFICAANAESRMSSNHLEIDKIDVYTLGNNAIDVKVNSSNPSGKLEVFNTIGERILIQEVVNNNTILNLPTGLYIIYYSNGAIHDSVEAPIQPIKVIVL